MSSLFKQKLVLLGKRTAILSLAVVLGFATLLYSLMYTPSSKAAQLTPREVEISTSVGDASASYKFSFDIVTDATVDGIIFEFCTTPLGTCTLPTGMAVTHGTAQVNATQTFDDTNAFTEVTADTGDCDAATGTTFYCVSRTSAAQELAANSKEITIDTITNPTFSANFVTVFVRMTLYDNSGFVSGGGAGSQIVHDGTVATAIVNQLTTTGRVQERLEFCVAAITEAAWDTAFPPDCPDASWPTTTLVDLGVIDNLSIKSSPVNNTVTDPANDSFGIAMVDTNASNGVRIAFFPEEATNVLGGDTDQLRAFRVLPTDCNPVDTTLTDQCFHSALNTGEAITAGSELFGLNIACIVDSTGTTDGNLSKPAQGATIATGFNNDLDDAPNTVLEEAVDCENEAVEEVGFSNSGTLETLASTNTVVDDEMLVIRFHATAESTTPTGQYTVVTTYVATPTY